MKILLEKLLRAYATAILNKYNPEIVGITGSVGKTSTKEAIFRVLSYQFNVRKNIKNYNNELGVPLTIINAEAGGKSLYKWLKVFYRATKLLLWKDKEYPEILVLEMGTDKPGDIPYLLEFVKLKIGVLTAVSESHLEMLKDVKGVLKEKEGVVTSLRDDGSYAILNQEDSNVMSLIEKDKIKVPYYSYGFGEQADVKASETLFSGFDKDFCKSQYDWDCKVWGTQCKVTSKGSTVPIFLPHCIGKQHVYAVLAGVAVGVAYKMNLVDISEALRKYRPMSGRMRLLAGIKHTLIIDDTYNSSPRAVKAALETMKDLELPETAKTIAVLGDMLELGDVNEDKHREIGFKVVENDIDYLITVGKESIITAEAAMEAGMDQDHVFVFDTADEARKTVQNIMAQGDLVLVKGSQGVRMEKIVKEIMADPAKADKFLVRQTKEWQKR